MNSWYLKPQAKMAMAVSAVNPYLFTFIYFCITFLQTFVQGVLETGSRLMERSGDFRGAEILLPAMIIFAVVQFILTTWLGAGYVSYCLKVARKDSSMSYLDLFSSYRYLLKAMGLSVMTGIFVFLWSLLFIIPGIIASYRYIQALRILVDDPSKGIFQCIRESKEMMAGNKMDYFLLELSFLPWNLLSLVTCGLSIIYVMPYQGVTLALYYDKIKPRPYEEAENI